MNQRKKAYYSLEFKQDAAQLILSKGYSYEEAATSLGASVSALRRWVRAENGNNTTVSHSGSVAKIITDAKRGNFGRVYAASP